MSYNLYKEKDKLYLSHQFERALNFKNIIKEILGSNLSGKYFLDIGGGNGINSSIIAENFHTIYSLDIYIPPISKQQTNVIYIQGNAKKLPFQDGYFNAVSLFSSIEHIPNPEQALNEVSRVLKQNGILIIQYPNQLFLFDSHSCLPNPFFLPKKIRDYILKKLGFKWWINYCHFITNTKILKLLKNNFNLIGSKHVINPICLIPNGFKLIYKFYCNSGLIHLYPMGYLHILRKK